MPIGQELLDWQELLGQEEISEGGPLSQRSVVKRSTSLDAWRQALLEGALAQPLVE